MTMLEFSVSDPPAERRRVQLWTFGLRGNAFLMEALNEAEQKLGHNFYDLRRIYRILLISCPLFDV